MGMQFNDAAKEYWKGHANNAVASLSGGETTPVKPWFGKGGYLEEVNGSNPGAADQLAAPASTQPATAPPSQQQGQPTVAPTPQSPASGKTDAVAALAGVRTTQSHARTLPGQDAAQRLSTPGQQHTSQFKVKMADGMVYEAGDTPGTRKFTIGTPGQDGGGVGTANGAFGFNDRDRQAISVLSRPVQAVTAGQPPIQQSPSIQALSGVDNAPQEKSPLEISHENWKNMSINQTGEDQSGKPRYLTREEGAALGLGWQGRLAKYKEDVDMYNKANINKTAMDLEQMRELGAGGRALLQAKVHNDANSLALQKLPGELALNEAQTAAARLAGQKGQMEIGSQRKLDELNNKLMASSDPKEQRSLHRQILALHGKPDNQKYQIVTREEVDPKTLATIKTPYVIDQDNPTNAFKVGGAGEQTLTIAPVKATDRKKGQLYKLPSGVNASWDGNGWKPAP